MWQEIGQETKKRFFGELLDDILGYWRIYDGLKLKFLSRIKNAVEIKTENEFWYSILSDRYAGEIDGDYLPLRNGQIIKLKDFFISEWAPKLPGQAWTIQGSKDLIEAYKRIDKRIKFNDKLYSVLDPYGKEKVVSAGYGSIRLNPKIGSEDFYMYMSLVTKRNWHCDLGIPLVVSKSVYNEFYKYAKYGAPWVEGMEGVLHFQEDLPFKIIIPHAIGARISEELEEVLRYKPFLPKCHVYVSSPLNIKFKLNDSHPNCTAWTMFETHSSREPYRYTYTKCDPNDNESIQYNGPQKSDSMLRYR